MAVARMRLPCLSFIIAAALFISCARPEKSANTSTTPQVSNRAGRASATGNAPDHPCLNLNRATIEELAGLPGVGEVMSRRIIEYRETHGPFRRPEEIIIIEGFSEQKYRALAGLVCVE